MRFIGLDLAWGAKNTSAAVTFERDAQSGALSAVSHADALTDDDSICAYIAANDVGGGLIVGVDAPLDVPNETGERPVESVLRRCFGRFQAGAHPANRSLYGGDIRGERLAARLEREFDMTSGFAFAPRSPHARYVVEVFPHPAQVVLFGLTKTLKYKLKRGRDLPSRLAEFARFSVGLRELQNAVPSLVPPNWLHTPEWFLAQSVIAPSALKRIEDEMDALVCAYVAAYFWYWGDGEQCMIIGDKATGYIITPVTSELRQCAETFWQEKSLPRETDNR
jgi:predicted RNase H-like nuclease